MQKYFFSEFFELSEKNLRLLTTSLSAFCTKTAITNYYISIIY